MPKARRATARTSSIHVSGTDRSHRTIFIAENPLFSPLDRRSFTSTRSGISSGAFSFSSFSYDFASLMTSGSPSLARRRSPDLPDVLSPASAQSDSLSVNLDFSRISPEGSASRWLYMCPGRTLHSVIYANFAATVPTTLTRIRIVRTFLAT